MDIICYSHLRWNFVYQRPQHLLSRMAAHFRVFYIEEPIFDVDNASLSNEYNEDKICVIVPHLPLGLSPEEALFQQNELLKKFFVYMECKHFIAWYYTPMAVGLNATMTPDLVIFDCMDELSAFKNAPFELQSKEKTLLSMADIVFTGGESLYDAKKNKHPNVHLFPSSIDKKHFEKARRLNTEMDDQGAIPYPRIGYFGVIDERMDIDLLEQIATLRPDWQLVLIGPVVKIDPQSLPRNKNIHYLGPKHYKELPYYISKWDVAMMPFAINDSTRFISPTKTPEYLAAGKPVVSTPIHDVVSAWGEGGLVAIAGTPGEFVSAIEDCLTLKHPALWMKAVDLALSQQSWDITTEKMLYIINSELDNIKIPDKKNHEAYV